MFSCIYEGRVAHRRYRPLEHSFDFRVFMAYLDLEELENDRELKRLIPRGRLATVAFNREDYLDSTTAPLPDSVRDLVQNRTGVRPEGPIRMLCQMRYMGFYFSPLNLYFCHMPNGDIQTVVAEVNNTPWNERHHYVLWEGNRTGVSGGLRFEHPKNFHVSPFMEMDMLYRWNLSAPDSSLRVSLQNIQAGDRIFKATMSLTRQQLTRWQLNRTLLRYPLMTAKISAAIYWQALKLWRKKCPYHSHPKNLHVTSTHP
ncbi:MAG: DUF1365 family protein [Pirellulaceae bacterium]|jgi:DUF1365 family protein